MPISVYKLLCKDDECEKLAPSKKTKVKTYCTEKIQIIGSCDLFVLHPGTKCLQAVTFQVTRHEGNVIISCASSLQLGLIQPITGIDLVPEKGSLIYSKADLPVKQNKKVETKSKQQWCQALSPTVFNDKNQQADKSINMWPKKPKKVCSQKDQQC